MGTVEKLAFYLLKKVNKDVRHHDLIMDGDRIVVTVSGAKDTLSPLRLLNHRRPLVKGRYDLVAVNTKADLSCGGDVPRSTRAKMNDLLVTVEKDCPQAKVNLFRAVQRYGRRCAV